MIDPELKNYLSRMQDTLEQIRRRGGRLSAFANGVVGGLGSAIGFALAIALIGWLLNVIGIIPNLRETADDLQNALQETQQFRAAPLNNGNK